MAGERLLLRLRHQAAAGSAGEYICSGSMQAGRGSVIDDLTTTDAGGGNTIAASGQLGSWSRRVNNGVHLGCGTAGRRMQALEHITLALVAGDCWPACGGQSSVCFGVQRHSPCSTRCARCPVPRVSFADSVQVHSHIGPAAGASLLLYFYIITDITIAMPRLEVCTSFLHVLGAPFLYGLSGTLLEPAKLYCRSIPLSHLFAITSPVPM